MQAKHIFLVFIVLVLIFLGIWIASPKVGETIEQEEGTDVEFIEDGDVLPEKLPDGFVRYKNVADAVVYRKVNEDNSVTYYEYVGNDEFTYYDINKPYYLKRTTFDNRIYQIYDDDNGRREEYRAFLGDRWVVVSKEYKEIFSIPENYTMVASAPNLYCVKEGDKIFYKLLAKFEDKYVWLNPVETDEWIKVEVPDNYKKTIIPNMYEGKDGEETIYRKVLVFGDIYKTVAVVACDIQENFI